LAALFQGSRSAALLLLGATLFLSPVRACDEGTLAPLAQISAALEQKKTTSVALVHAYLQRIADCNGQLHAIIATNPDALTEADALDRERAAGKVRGPLHGIPVIIKDNIDLAGSVTTAGSLALAGNFRDRNAPVVDRLEAAGLIVIAKANLSE